MCYGGTPSLSVCEVTLAFIGLQIYAYTSMADTIQLLPCVGGIIGLVLCVSGHDHLAYLGLSHGNAVV